MSPVKQTAELVARQHRDPLSAAAKQDSKTAAPKIIFGLLAGLMVSLTLAASPAHALRCGNQLITEGRSALDLLHRCGEPDYRSYRYAPGSDEVVREVWYYNFGSRRMLQKVSLERGEVRRVETAGRGFNRQPDCEPHQIEPGWSDFELIARCGEPDVQVSYWDSPLIFPERQYRRHIDGPHRPSARLSQGGIQYHRRYPDRGHYPHHRHDYDVGRVRVDEWQYNFGSRHLTRIIRLENGTIRRVETGGYGYRR